MRKILIFTLLLIGLMSCNTSNKTTVDVSHILVDVRIARFETDFYSSTPEQLPELKQQYPMLFPHDIDSVWIHKIQNKDEQALFAETQKLYQDFSSEKQQLKTLFQHIKYYQPDFKEPTVVTLLTNMDSRVLYADNFLFISLDNYLGKRHPFYADYPQYIRQQNTRQHLIVDVAKAITNAQVQPNTKRTFLSKMIYEGKKQYLLDLYLPAVPDYEKMGYSQKKFDWAKANEETIWRYFIDKALLYSTDAKLNARFLDLAPFSKFYTEQDAQSPGQVGVYMGWQIVRAFMKNNDVSLHEMLQTSEESILRQSRYKPNR